MQRKTRPTGRIFAYITFLFENFLHFLRTSCSVNAKSNAAGGGEFFSVHRPITLRRDTRHARCKDYIKYPPFKVPFSAITKFKLDSELPSFRFDILFVVCVGISVVVSVGVRQSVMAVSYHRSWPCPTIGHGARIFSNHIRRFLLFYAKYLTYSHSPALKHIFLASLPPISS